LFAATTEISTGILRRKVRVTDTSLPLLALVAGRYSLAVLLRNKMNLNGILKQLQI